MTIHEKSIEKCQSYCNDGRVRRVGTAIRWLRERRQLRRAVRDALLPGPTQSLDFRRDTYCSSGRSLCWYMPKFIAAGAMIRDLAQEGYSAGDARRIAMSAVHCEPCIWAVADAPPASTANSTKADSKYGDHMEHWAANVAENLKITQDHVWKWQVWRERNREPANVGRRTRQWMAVVRLDLAKARTIAQAKAKKWSESHLASLPDALKNLQKTCRCECIVVSADGKSVTERLHDCGGAMTNVVGMNGYALPQSLAEHQAMHDAIYHPSAA